MKKIFNFICGIGAVLMTLCGTFFVGVLIYDYQPNTTGIFAIAVFGMTMSYAAFKLFDEIYTNGIVEFMTAINEISELDHLRYTHSSEFKPRTPYDLMHLVTTDQHLCKGGTLNIFGDWFGEPYENSHQINNIEFDTASSVLTIHFDKGKTLKIWNPKHIHETTSYLKIISADKIRLEWHESDDTENAYFKMYEKTERRIKVATNFDKRKTNTALKQAALMIYGKIG